MNETTFGDLANEEIGYLVLFALAIGQLLIPALGATAATWLLVRLIRGAGR